ncbi:MAG TPA: M48 family metallopeptidase [Firmicutes bacterium]|nr:M48 family metallopeptidase [Bacillota bacterium]
MSGREKEAERVQARRTDGMEYSLIRSSRRTLALYILPDGRVEARAPRRLPLREIERFLAEKRDWIRAGQEKAAARRAEQEALRPAVGGTLPLEGREYPVAAGAAFGFDGNRFFFPPEGWPAVREALTAFYRERTERLLRARLDRYADRAGVRPVSVRVGSAVRRWGSCSGRGGLRFSWMLAAAGEREADYVMVHELCHLREHNHSPAFWRLVEELLPDYRERRAMLRRTERRVAALTRSDE